MFDEESEFLSYSFEYIKTILGDSGSILEFGSGNSSGFLADKGYKVTAVEHDPRWTDKFDNVEYIFAPLGPLPPSKYMTKKFGLNKLWYDGDIIKSKLEGRKFDLVIIDGPPANVGRAGIFLYSSLLGDSPIILDDTARDIEQRLAHAFAKSTNRYMLTVPVDSGREFCILASKDVLVRVLENPENQLHSSE